MASNSTAFLPGWLLLVIGIGIGQSSQSMDTLERLVTSFQAFVNIVLVPLYTICVFIYLFQLLLPRCKSDPIKAVVPPPPTLIPEDEDGHVNMTGSYKLISNENYENFLATQGVPWALRGAANHARPIHKITHVGDSLTIQIKGIIESQTTYVVGGPPVQTAIRGRVFEDTVTYLEDGIQSYKRALTENYDITVSRRLSKDRQTVTMTSRAVFRDDREPVESVQVFQRIE